MKQLLGRVVSVARAMPILALMGQLVLASSAHAVDGVIEINQTCAVNTGCFAGDAAGFPVTVSQSGSYRLTGDLVVPGGVSGIQENGAADVSIDLNGFSIIGPGPPAAAADGIRLSQAKNWVIRNGTIRDFTNRGIADSTSTAEGHRIIEVRVVANSSLGISLGGTGHLIKDCTIQNNGTIGVAPGANSLLIGNIIEGNGGAGISFNGLGNGYGNNVINANAGGAVVSSATQISGNVCNNALCP